MSVLVDRERWSPHPLSGQPAAPEREPYPVHRDDRDNSDWVHVVFLQIAALNIPRTANWTIRPCLFSNGC
jgi:hypothetical protein